MIKQIISKTDHLILTLLSIVILTGCFSPGHLRKSPYFLQSPPGGIALNDTLWYDKTEVTNVDWKEYLFWLKRIYGQEHDMFIAAHPDTTALARDYGSEFNDEPLPGGGIYFRHIAYNDYPVIGVSHQQAEDYSKWRSDRVYEALLIKNGVIEYNREQTPENHFTIARYQQGVYETFELPDRYVYYPVYRLPTDADRALIMKLTSSDTKSAEGAKALKSFRNVMTWKLFLHD